MKALRSIVSSAFLIAIVSAGSDPALAQEKESKPTPGPEHKKLGYFVGDWSTEGEMKANSLAPAGKYSTSDHCKWFEGNFALVCQSEGKSPAGPTKAHYVLGYSTEEKIYVYYGIDNSAMVPTTVAKGSVQGGTWTYTDESRMGGKVVKSRYTLTEMPPAAYSFKWEIEGEDGKWTELLTGKSTKKAAGKTAEKAK